MFSRLKLLKLSLYMIIFAAILSSLLFEFVLHLVPCFLCWWQRIFWYSMGLVALLINETEEKLRFFKITSLLGSFFALYHVLLQRTDLFVSLCGGDNIIDCSQIQYELISGVSIPVLSLLGFLLVFILSLLAKMRLERESLQSQDLREH